ncbi:hypothetical protein WICANDRAFT_94846, partial [Wickerhamomyces anomalus NRRL Y-366-8]
MFFFHSLDQNLFENHNFDVKNRFRNLVEHLRHLFNIGTTVSKYTLKAFTGPRIKHFKSISQSFYAYNFKALKELPDNQECE